MKIENKIEKRLENINEFLKSKNKTKPDAIHLFRLEIKKLETFVELITVHENGNLLPKIPNRLEKLYHVSGKARKFNLEIDNARCIVRNQSLPKPEKLIEWLSSSKKKKIHQLIKKSKDPPALRMEDFMEHRDSQMSAITWQAFLINRADCMLELLMRDLFTDVRLLHQLRKLLKSVIYVRPLVKKSPVVHSFLKSEDKLVKTVESIIGSIHDYTLFIKDLEKMPFSPQTGELGAIETVRKSWRQNIKSLKEKLQPLLPDICRFALTLKEKIRGMTVPCLTNRFLPE